MSDSKDDDMEAPVTRRELREEFANFEERFEQKLEQKLEQLGQRLEQRLEEKLEQKLDQKLEQKLEQKLGQFEERVVRRLSLELAQHVNASAEQHRVELSVIDERYRSLPGRVEKLEERVFAAPPAATKRAHRPKRRTPAK